jgi:carboxylesterase
MPGVTAPIIPGAEPFSQAGGPSGVLVLHGFTGNPVHAAPGRGSGHAGYTVDLPLLPGHGTTIEDMIPTRWADWSGRPSRPTTKLAANCDEVAVVALSMGGTLACWLAEHHPEIRGLALVNPFIDPPAESFRDVMRGLLEAGTDIAPGSARTSRRRGWPSSAYPGTPIAAALSAVRGDRRHGRRSGRISCPVLLLSSRDDHVVPSSSGDVLEAGVRGPVERVWLENSYHVATLDNDADDITSPASSPSSAGRSP